MGYKERRKIVRFGSMSRGITIPKGWLSFYGLREHDQVTVLGDSVLIVARPEDETEAHRVLHAFEKKKIGNNRE